MPEFDLKAKLGPLPVWAWGVIVGVLALIGYFVFYRRAGAASEASVTSANIDAMGYSTSGLSGGPQGDNYAAPVENNMTWLTRVSRSVADTLAASPVEVYNALYKFVTGQDLTAKEKTYVDKGIEIGMSPPEGTQGIGKILAEPSIMNYPRSSVGVIRRQGSGDVAILYADQTKKLLSVSDYVSMGSPPPNVLPDSVYDSYQIV